MKKLFFITLISLLNLICYTILFSQTEWEKYPQNPVLLKSNVILDWDYFAAADPCVISDGDTLKIWYTGAGTVHPDTTIAVRIGYAYSLDGINWIKHSENPVLSPTPGAWDGLGIETVTVIKDTSTLINERYRMWYAGSDDPICGLYQIGYAYSSDGIHWTKYSGNPVLTNGNASSWENAGPEGPTVIKDGDTLKMWYAALDTIPDNQPTDFHLNIGYAWSIDGVQWEKYPDNPILTTGNFSSWEFAYIQDPCVIKNNDLYHMWYSGFSDYDVGGAQIGYAYSIDGINWTKSEVNPVLTKGEPGSWDANTASFPGIIWDSSTIHMWYTGIDIFPLPEWPEPYYWDIGYAISNLDSTYVIENNIIHLKEIVLNQNYPNPFNPVTEISFNNQVDGNIELSIFNIKGQKIKTLLNSSVTKGDHSVKWSGDDETGKSVSSGIYFYQLKTDNYSSIKKCLLLK